MPGPLMLVAIAISCSSEVGVDKLLEPLLAARDGLRLDALLLDPVRQVGEAALALEDGAALGSVPAGVAGVEPLGELAVLDHPLGDEQRPGAQVHRPGMGGDQVVGGDRLAAQLGVEVEAAAAEATALHDLVERERDL